MKIKDITKNDVKKANQTFYDSVADKYEDIDGRRSHALESWLHNNLKILKDKTSGSCILDIGAGSGLVTRCAEGIFSSRVGVDISPSILSRNKQCFDLGVAGDIDQLPFKDNTFDVISCFAVLHHLYDFEGLVKEISRVLKPGGIFYSDHDMDAAFNNKFKGLLSIYRKIKDSKGKYVKSGNDITEELYHLTEWQESGIQSAHLVNRFNAVGFNTKPQYHWYGLSPITNFLFGKRIYKKGYAPLFSLLATKS